MVHTMIPTMLSPHQGLGLREAQEGLMAPAGHTGNEIHRRTRPTIIPSTLSKSTKPIKGKKKKKEKIPFKENFQSGDWTNDSTSHTEERAKCREAMLKSKDMASLSTHP